MLADILQGSHLGPGEGWFKKAVAQTRYDWKSARQWLDRDHDGRVARVEFAGSDADFQRLDRDRDASLGAPDFDFSAHALTPSPGAIAFYAADRDGNGKLTREELETFFRSADSGGAGFLAALGPPRGADAAVAGEGRLERAQPAHLDQGPVPSGDRLAPARPGARHARARLHPQDR